MVGIVIISHSRKIAEGLEELARQMTPGSSVPIAAAGGIDDPESPLGTDAAAVLRAIERVYSPDGVCIFVDLGSAKLSAEAAVELLPEEKRKHLLVCDAPLVEGVLVAAVQASAGADVDTISREARAAIGRLRGEDAEAAGEQPGELSAEITLTNALGLHARPAARLVSLLGSFKCSVRLRNATRGGDWADARSMTGVLTRDARKGDVILLRFAGANAEEARRAVIDLAARGFDDRPAEARPASAPAAAGRGEAMSGAPASGAATGPTSGPAPAAGSTETPDRTGAQWRLRGLRISPGFATGPALRHRPLLPEVAYGPTKDTEHEVKRLIDAVERSGQEIRDLEAESRLSHDAYESSIFQAHRLFLDDPALTGRAVELIKSESLTAETAWHRVVIDLLGQYAAIQDEALRARADDLRDVGARILRHLAVGEADFFPHEEGILLVPRLNPSEVSQVERSPLLGVCAASGSRASHSAILSRSLKVPVLFDLGSEMARIQEGTPLAIDGEQGILYIRPTAEVLSQIESKRAAWLARMAAAQAVKELPSTTSDGRRIELLANIAGIEDLDAALAAGAEGVGLFRTEFLFMGRAELPDEEEQEGIYEKAASMLDKRPLVARTLDSGGDKPVAALERLPEPNPFLGVRGIRLTLAEPELFRTQLRALLRAAKLGNLRIMLPMISDTSEVAASRAMIEAERPEYPVKLGIMIEVPAAAQMLDRLLPIVDFVSIGTNDLAQYIMAADRTNSRVEELADSLQPAVLRTVAAIVKACDRASVPVSLCGELAGSPEALPLLIGLGLTSLSMNPGFIPEAKLLVRTLRYPLCRSLAVKALECSTIAEVRALLARFAQENASALTVGRAP